MLNTETPGPGLAYFGYQVDAGVRHHKRIIMKSQAALTTEIIVQAEAYTGIRAGIAFIIFQHRLNFQPNLLAQGHGRQHPGFRAPLHDPEFDFFRAGNVGFKNDGAIILRLNILAVMPYFLNNIFSDIRCKPDANTDRFAVKYTEAGFHKFIDEETAPDRKFMKQVWMG